MQAKHEPFKTRRLMLRESTLPPVHQSLWLTVIAYDTNISHPNSNLPLPYPSNHCLGLVILASFTEHVNHWVVRANHWFE